MNGPFPKTEPALPEPWLRGPVSGVDARLAPVLYSFEQASEDLARHTEGLTAGQIWSRPHELPSVGFQLRHIAGSVDRLTSYLQGRQLSGEQMAALRAESEPGATREELIGALNAALNRVAAVVRSGDPGTLSESRQVGRKKLPTTVAGLLVHIAEHTQRHVGQAITTAKVVRAVGARDGA